MGIPALNENDDCGQFSVNDRDSEGNKVSSEHNDVTIKRFILFVILMNGVEVKIKMVLMNTKIAVLAYLLLISCFFYSGNYFRGLAS